MTAKTAALMLVVIAAAVWTATVLPRDLTRLGSVFLFGLAVGVGAAAGIRPRLARRRRR